MDPKTLKLKGVPLLRFYSLPFKGFLTTNCDTVLEAALGWKKKELRSDEVTAK
jgi:hypothetical protein